MRRAEVCCFLETRALQLDMRRRGRVYELAKRLSVSVVLDDEVSYEDLEELLEDIHFARPNNSRGCEGYCWIRGKDSTVYTRTEVNGELKQAHRVSYEVFTGNKIKDYGCHKCDTPACINPNHIYDGKNWQNIRDAKEEKTARNTGVKHPKILNSNILRKLKKEYRQKIIDQARFKSELSRNPKIREEYIKDLRDRLDKITGAK